VTSLVGEIVGRHGSIIKEGRQSTLSNHPKSWLFTSTPQNFAINRINSHLCTTFADPDGVTLGSTIHFC
jgi:hypothetical protein